MAAPFSNRRRRRPSKAEALAFLALLASLCATAWAGGIVPDDSVYSKTIVNREVHWWDISGLDGTPPAVSTEKLVPGAVDSRVVKNQSVVGSDLGLDLTGNDIADQSLGAADINEGSLEELGAAFHGETPPSEPALDLTITYRELARVELPRNGSYVIFADAFGVNDLGHDKRFWCRVFQNGQMTGIGRHSGLKLNNYQEIDPNTLAVNFKDNYPLEGVINVTDAPATVTVGCRQNDDGEDIGAWATITALWAAIDYKRNK